MNPHKPAKPYMPPKQSLRIQIQHQENPKMSNSPNTPKIEITTDIKIYTEILRQNQVQESKYIPTETLKKKRSNTSLSCSNQTKNSFPIIQKP